MNGHSIAYKGGYKYQLHRTFPEEGHPQYNVGIVGRTIETPYIHIDQRGNLQIRAGYAWDGPSGPTFDTDNFMIGSLVHDALYQLIREGKLARTYRKHADLILRKQCRKDGMSWLRAQWVYYAVRAFARKAALPSQTRPIFYAP